MSRTKRALQWTVASLVAGWSLAQAQPAALLETARGTDPAARIAARGTDQLIVRLEPTAAKRLAAASLVSSLTARLMAKDHARDGLASSTLSYRRHVDERTLVLKLNRFHAPAELDRLMTRLAGARDVVSIEPDRIAVVASVPNDPLYASQWALQTPDAGNQGGLNLPGAWSRTTGIASQVVAVLDTGVLNHPDLGGRLLAGYDFVSNTDRPRGNDGNGRDADATDTGDWVSAAEAAAGQPFEGCAVVDSSWHGTEIAGVIAANSGNATGMAGINWNAKILPVRVIGKCGGYVSDIADGIRWAAGLSVAGAPINPNPAQVINLSLAVPTLGACDSVLRDAIQAVGAINVPVVAAAGNNNAQASQYSPGNCAAEAGVTNVITVTAISRDGGLPRNGQGNVYANTGAPILVAAPGGSLGLGVAASTANSIASASDNGLTAANNNGGYSLNVGTSFAAAHVSGVVSLMQALNPGMTVADIKDVLAASVRPFPAIADACNPSLCGTGIVDAGRAVQLADRWRRTQPQVASGSSHFIALRSDGAVFAWGDNGSGQLGIAFSGATNPVRVTIPPALAIAAGSYNSYALLADGTVMSWGGTPALVPGLSQGVMLVAGENHALLLREDGTVWSWGRNSEGQLGLGDTVDRSVPVMVPGLANVVSIGAGQHHSFALLANGTTWAWGSNEGGNLGDGTQTQRNSPVQIVSATGLTRITGGRHTLAVGSGGGVLSWGLNSSGQLGNGSTTSNVSPAAVAAIAGAATPVAAVTAPVSMVILQDGTLRAWGDNSHYQLGDGTAVSRLSPVVVRKLADVTSAAVGGQQSIAVRGDGTVWVWGRNRYGATGLDVIASPAFPAQVQEAGAEGYYMGYFTLQALAFATVREALPGRAYGSNTIVPVTFGGPQAISIMGGTYAINGGSPTQASGMIAAGQSVSVQLTAPAECGVSVSATLTIGAATYTFSVIRGACDDLPDPVSFATQGGVAPSSTVVSNTVTISGLSGPMPISVTGGSYSIGCTGSFTSASGSISNGQTLCLSVQSGSFTSESVTARITIGGAEFTFTVISGNPALMPNAFRFNTLLSVPRSTLMVSNAVTITGISVPIPISVIGGEYSIGCTGTFTSSSGMVSPGATVCVRLMSPSGYADEGSLLLSTGDLDTLFVVYTEPAPGFSATPQVAAGAYHSLALRADGTVLTWGENYLGELGNDEVDQSDRPAPAYITGVIQIAAGDYRSLALRLDGTVWSWGSGDSYPSPVTAVGSGVTAIAAGRFHSLALKSDGTVWSWGDVPSLEPVVPTQVAGLSGITAIFASGRSSFALKNNGTVWAWGDNFRGQLGAGSAGNVITTPTQVSGLINALEIGGGDYHNLARFAAGVFKSWGSNQTGELGNGGSADLNQPATLAALTTVAGVGRGSPDGWSLARLADGTVRSWGQNNNGQLGNGTTTLSRLPVVVSGLGGVTQVAAGSAHGLAVADGASVWSWGNNTFGQVGQEPGSNRLRPAQVRAPHGELGNLSLDDQAFAPVYGAVPGTAVFSNSLMLRGIAPSSPITVAGGEFRIGIGTFSSAASLVSAGQSVSVRLPSAPACGDSATVTLTVAGTPRQFVVTSEPCDLTPDDLLFNSRLDVPVSSVQISNAATVTGLGASAPVSVTGGEYSIGCSGTFTSASGSIANGQSVCLRQTASSLPATSTVTSLTIGTRTFTFSVTTLSAVAFETAPQLTGGTTHLVVLRSDGKVFTIGSGAAGQLGDGTFNNATAPVQASISNVKAVASGGDLTLALRSDGTVWRWGNGNATPTAVAGLDNVTFISVGQNHSLAVRSDGTVWAWGSNNRGQLGNGTQTDSAVPVQVPGLTGVIAVAGGGNFSLALKADGTVMSWGRNFYGQLGDGTSTDRLSPVPVPGLSGVVQIVAGDLHSMARTADGGFWAWGSNDFGELGNGGYEGNPDFRLPSRIPGLAVLGVIAQGTGSLRSLVSLADGTVYNWGLNSNRFGNGSFADSLIPLRVPGLINILNVGSSATASLALDSSGHVFTWGQSVTELPAPAGSPPGARFRAYYYTSDLVTLVPIFGVAPSALVESSSVTISGLESGISTLASIAGGELSVNGGAFTSASVSVQNGHTLRVRVQASSDFDTTTSAILTLGGIGAQRATFYVRTRPNLSAAAKIPRISLGQSHSFLLNANGEVYTFGYNGNGQLGNGTTLSTYSPRPAPALANLVKIASGYFHGLGLKDDGTVLGWGFNESGAVGIGTTSAAVEQPTLIGGLANVTALSAGRYHSLALSAGQVYAWGLNAEGQLGLGSNSNQPAPQSVSGLSGIVAIAAGGAHSLALAANGTLYVWGRNASGQLGTGNTTQQNSPVALGFSGAVSIAACGEHSLILKNDGTVWAMGGNGFGQLGNGSTTNQSVPVQVSGLSAVGLIACGEQHSLAVTSGGTLYTWGGNTSSQLGEGTNTNRSVAQAVVLPGGATLSNIVAIAGGGLHSAALRADGSLFIWGDNYFGQVGNRSGNYNPQSGGLNVLRGDTRIVEVVGGSGTAVGTASNAGSGQLYLNDQNTGYNFGDVNVGSSGALAGQLDNTAFTDALEGISVETGGSGFVVSSNSCPAGVPGLAAGTSCPFSLSFTPVSAGESYGYVSVGASNMAGRLELALYGRGVSAGSGALKVATQVSPAGNNVVDFAPVVVGTASGVQTIGVGNSGSGVLAVNLIEVSQGQGDFTVSHSCTVIQPGSSCPVEVRFVPGTAGERQGLVTVSTNVGTDTITLKGTGSPRLEDTTPDGFSFTSVTGAAAGTQVVSAAITITGLTAATTISISNGEYSVGCTGTWTSAVGTISNGQTLCVRHTAAAAANTTVTTVITIGGLTGTFQSTSGAAAPFTLTTTRTGSGSGTVTGTGINCGADCSESLSAGTSVTLTATPAQGSSFTSWSGISCTGGNTTPTCSFTLNANTTVTASFDSSLVVPNDFNDDAKSDLLWRNNADGAVQGWLMNGLTATQVAGLLPAGGYTVTHVADLDGNGKADTLIKHTDGTTIGWLHDGLSVVGQATFFAASSGWSIKHTADLNGDGKADLIVEHTNGTVVGWLMNGLTVTGTATFVPAGTGWSVARTGDLNGDGKADLIWQNTNGTVQAWLMDGLSATATATFVGTGTGWSVKLTADLNGDNKADLVWQNTDGTVQAWLMNGTAITQIASFVPAGTGWSPVLAGDIDGDGKADLFWEHTDGRSQTWLMNGLSVTSLAGFVGAGGWKATHLFDLNGDGKKDVLWKHTDGTVQAWLMNGLTISQIASLAGAGSYAVIPPRQ